ncbi:hypothetical protein OIU78_013415, partial [Salix suchowensis]
MACYPVKNSERKPGHDMGELYISSNHLFHFQRMSRIYFVCDNLVWASVISKLSDIRRPDLATVLSTPFLVK